MKLYSAGFLLVLIALCLGQSRALVVEPRFKMQAHAGESNFIGEVYNALENKTHYSYARMQVQSLPSTAPLFNKSLFSSNLILTILEDSYLMSDRKYIILTLDNSTHSFESLGEKEHKMKGKVSQVSDATMPVDTTSSTLLVSNQEASSPDRLYLTVKHHSGFLYQFDLKRVDYTYKVYYPFVLGFVVLTCLQIYAFRIMTEKAKEDMERYLKKISLHGLLLDTTMNSCILYHFGVLLPIDIKIVIPQITLMIHSSFFWMQKLVFSMQNQPNQRMPRCFQFVSTMVMMIGGLYVPSLDSRSYSLLICTVFPIFFQILNSFTSRVGSFSWEYNLLFKIPHLCVVLYIYGWPGPAAHLLPTYPWVAFYFLLLFVVLTLFSYLQKIIHPRFYFKTFGDYKRMLYMPKRAIANELIAKNEHAECAICLTDLKDSPMESALVTSCNHVFHEKCLLDWLVKHENCPICRETVIHPDANYFDNS